MSQLIENAIHSRVPLIHVTSTDLVYVPEVLSFISGEQVYPLELDELGNHCDLDFNIYYTSQEVVNKQLFLEFMQQGKTLIYVNTKLSSFQFNAGLLMPPHKMMVNYLSDLIPEDESVEDLVMAFSGLTLKEMYDTFKITDHKVDKISRADVNSTRREFISNVKGLEQIETEFDFYQCPTYLSKWLKSNSQFFISPKVPSLIPRGILLDGIPGTGKTAASKFIAKEWGLPLYRLDVGAIKDKYVGNSEQHLRNSLAQLDKVQPCLVLIDEVEKAFTTQLDSGVTSNLLGSLLWWLQEHTTRVFTIMTTNNKDTIPKELYREGRIDDIMVFKGLENIKDATDFSSQVLGSLFAKLELEEDTMQEIKKCLQSRLQVLFAMGKAVPQVTVIKEVNTIVKQVISKG